MASFWMNVNSDRSFWSRALNRYPEALRHAAKGAKHISFVYQYHELVKCEA